MTSSNTGALCEAQDLKELESFNVRIGEKLSHQSDLIYRLRRCVSAIKYLPEEKQSENKATSPECLSFLDTCERRLDHIERNNLYLQGLVEVLERIV